MRRRKGEGSTTTALVVEASDPVGNLSRLSNKGRGHIRILAETEQGPVYASGP